ncbi:MAG: hypothetical protein AAGI01_16210, partial [Myxococcota bacterium]
IDFIERRVVGPEIDAMSLRQGIIEALEEELGIDPDDPEDGVFTLFNALYTGHPLAPGDVKMIRTATSIFFCIPLDAMRLATRQDEVLDTEQEEALASFLKKAGELKQRYMAHFPVFGFFRGEQVDPNLLGRISQALGVPKLEVADALTTMVSLLPDDKVDQYIVHDAWGHQWQALLFEFEESYREVSRYGYLPGLREDIRGFDGHLIDVLDAAISDAARGGAIDTSGWEELIRGELSRRFVQSLSGLLAEVLADAVEHKFLMLHPERNQDLMSSSFFKELPTKLDLTLHDLSLYFWFAVKGFERFYERPSHQRALAKAYIRRRRDANPEHVERALDALAARTRQLIEGEGGAYMRDFTPRTGHDEGKDHVEANVFDRVSLNFLAFQTEFNRAHATLAARKVQGAGPLARFQDALVFTSAAFFEVDRAKNFWLIDEFLAHHFIPCYDALLAALREEQAP